MERTPTLWEPVDLNGVKFYGRTLSPESSPAVADYIKRVEESRLLRNEVNALLQEARNIKRIEDQQLLQDAAFDKQQVKKWWQEEEPLPNLTFILDADF